MAAFVAQPAGSQAANLDRSTIVLDAAHGGIDGGAQIGEQVAEKDVTLTVAERLRVLLTADGFHVVMTRDGEADGGSLDHRAEVANRSNAVACVVVHASSSTKGVLVGTSALRSSVMRAANRPREEARTGVPWGRAQEAYVAQSGLLANQIGTALTRAGIPATMMRVMMRPLDNLTCPAISIEVGALSGEGAKATPVTDGGYQQRLAEAIAASLQLWRNQAQPADSMGAGL
ncbi:N-acetylmuramoyl-L-alanine amidase [Granulicella aggregans]|uniref:N-acetylmuramoyl-L-alanine amidase n=2 Tax=Granulicella aggregans TaxID=474949 RepID=A0A7W7ZHD9_9BACT|nr:N-acetylmuramoyl-L-alanine amidase [Granulicella aggregans]MBB5059758.1 N-acetylmuramoyl-L-alanine amidase [Granulicella aggregans]